MSRKELKYKPKLLSVILDILVNMAIFMTMIICINKVTVFFAQNSLFFTYIHVLQPTQRHQSSRNKPFLSVMLGCVFVRFSYKKSVLFAMQLFLCSIHVLEDYRLLRTVICVQKMIWQQWVEEEGRSWRSERGSWQERNEVIGAGASDEEGDGMPWNDGVACRFTLSMFDYFLLSE